MEEEVARSVQQILERHAGDLELRAKKKKPPPKTFPVLSLKEQSAKSVCQRRDFFIESFRQQGLNPFSELRTYYNNLFIFKLCM